MNNEMNDQIIQYQALKKERSNLNALVKEIEAEEKRLEALIIAGFDASGIKSIKLDGVGTVSKVTKGRVFISEADKFCAFAIDYLKDAMERGAHVLDALLFQQTPHQTKLKEYAANILGKDEKDISQEEFNSVFEQVGTKMDSAVTLSIRKL